MRLLIRWGLLGLLIFGSVQAFGQGAVRRFDTLANLLSVDPRAIATAGKASGEVLGRVALGDGGGGILDWDRTSTETTNRGTVFTTAGGAGGRWVLRNWSGSALQFGAVGDGAVDDAPAIQAALDYAETLTNSTASGAVVWLPETKRFRIGTPLVARANVSLMSTMGRSADRGYPKDNTAPRLIANAGLNAPILKFVDYTNASGTVVNPRMIVVRGIVFDGNSDNQSTNALDASGILIRSTLAKNISFEGCAFYDTVGYSIFALDGFNAGSIRECFLGNGLFTTVSADLKISDTDITGRTRGALSAGTPFPPIWLGPFTQKNQFSDVMVYMGPRAEAGFDNSLKRWVVAAANATNDTITLTATNGMFDGLPVVWRSGGSLPSGVQTNQLYHVLWSGSSTIQIATASGYRTRTPTDFGTVTLSSDVLQMGEAAMLYASGGSTVSQNAFSNLRVEDSYSDLVYLDGAHDNAFSTPMFGFSYTNTGRFVKLYRGAQGNTFSGGMMAWNYPNQFGQQPNTIVEIDAESRANRFEGVRMSNADVQTVVDRNTTEPGNVWDYEAPSTLWVRGLDASFRFWDFNGAITNSMWWNGNSVFWTLDEADPLNTYDWGFDGSNQILEVHGATAPGVRIQGYSASTAPAITLRNNGGSRATPTQTAAGATLGSIFFAGRDTATATSARAAITALTPASGWPSTTDTPAELWFAVTPDGSATRTNLFGLQGDLASEDTPLMVSVGGSAPQRVKQDAASGALYIGSYSGGSGGGSTNVTINGTSTNLTRINDSGDIVWPVSGGVATPVLSEDVSTTTLRANSLVLSNALDVAVGGSGRATLTANAYLAGNGTNPVSQIGPTAGALAGWNGSGVAAAITTGVGVTNVGGVLSGNYTPGSNVTFTTNASGSVSIAAASGGGGSGGVASGGGYLAASVTTQSVSNTTSATALFDFTLPGGVLGADGEEIEIFIPAEYSAYTSQADTFTASLYANYQGSGEVAIHTASPGTDAIPFISTTWSGYWRSRIKRTASDGLQSVTEFVIGADASGDTNNLLTVVRSAKNVTLDDPWTSDQRFGLVIELLDADTLHKMVTFGYTVKKLGGGVQYASLPITATSTTNLVLNFAYPVLTHSVGAAVNLIHSTNRPTVSTNVAFTTLRLVGDGSSRGLTWPAAWKRLGTNIATIPAGKVVLVSAMVTGTNETDVVFGVAKEE